MTIAHHPGEDLLAAFAAGSLDLGQRVAIATHLAACAGALGCSLSGSGPSLFALCRDAACAPAVAAAMTAAVRQHIGGEPQTYVSPIAPIGARVVHER